MDPELVKVVYAAVRERWQEAEAPFDGADIHRLLEDAGINVRAANVHRIWAYLEDMGAIETSDGSQGAPRIERVDTDWSPPHTNVTRI